MKSLVISILDLLKHASAVVLNFAGYLLTKLLSKTGKPRLYEGLELDNTEINPPMIVASAILVVLFFFVGWINAITYLVSKCANEKQFAVNYHVFKCTLIKKGDGNGQVGKIAS